MSQSKDYFKNFVNNHKFTFVASLASILSLALGLVIFFPAQKRPFYSVRSFNLINDSSSTIENLDIKYKVCNDNRQKEDCELEAIKSLTVTKILFWNGGRTKIDKTDIDDNPITIAVLNNHQILEAKLLHSSSDKTKFELEQTIVPQNENNKTESQKTYTINFAFLVSGDGGVIQVVHTGLSSKDITLSGYVEDSKLKENIKLVEVNRRKIEFIDILLFLPVTILLVSFLVYSFKDYKKRKNYLSLSFFLLYSLIYLSWLIFIAFPTFYQSTMNFPVNSYEVFNSEITPE